jgi:hypothetical protein
MRTSQPPELREIAGLTVEGWHAYSSVKKAGARSKAVVNGP